MKAAGARRRRASAAEHCIFFSRRQELIQLPLLNNAKVKRNGNYGVALWKHRHDGATPFFVFPKNKQSNSPIFPEEDGRALKSYSLFTSIVGSKMSNLSHHNNSLPLQIHLALHAHTTRQTKCFDFQTTGCLRLSPHKPVGRLFTGGQNDDDLQIYPATTLCFWPFLSRSRPKKPPFNPLEHTKGAIDLLTCTRL